VSEPIDLSEPIEADVNVAKRARMELFRATVTMVDGDDTAVERAMSDYMAAHPGDVSIAGTEQEIAEGAGTIGMELLAAGNRGRDHRVEAGAGDRSPHANRQLSTHESPSGCRRDRAMPWPRVGRWLHGSW